jgi:hypothetical protein
MLKIGFGSRIKPREFGFKPRFYDPAREELEQRLSSYKSTKSSEDIDQVKDRIRRGLKGRSRGDASEFRSQQTKQSNIRLILVIVFLFFLSYLLLSSNKVLKLIESLSTY